MLSILSTNCGHWAQSWTKEDNTEGNETEDTQKDDTKGNERGYSRRKAPGKRQYNLITLKEEVPVRRMG